MHYYTDVLKKYASFQGRARRSEYWMFALFNVVIALVLIGLAAATKSTVFYVLYVAYILAVILPSLGVLVRRLHDTGRSGAWFFISFVPFVGGLVLFIFTVLEGNPGPNEYGPNPKGADAYPGAAAPYAG
ncbi:DUF805 domain-containing protein [Streptomyces sp. NPDC006173]|uniref:DUF805 domain-containing protein n=1 Tax=Streptomyces sp. NPDC006173 TaxID=3155349 RepID=UPI00340B3924